MMKRFLISVLLSFFSLNVLAGTVVLGWDAYTNDTSVTTIKIYAAPSTNAFANGSLANATLAATTSVTNNTLAFTGLSSGYWSFAATAISSVGVESAPTTNDVSIVVKPATPSNLTIINVFVK